MGWRTVAAVVGLPSVLLTYYFAVFVPFSISVEEEAADSSKMEREFLSAQQASIEEPPAAAVAAAQLDAGRSGDDGMAQLAVNGSSAESEAVPAPGAGRQSGSQEPAGDGEEEQLLGGGGAGAARTSSRPPVASRPAAPRTRARFVSCPA